MEKRNLNAENPKNIEYAYDFCKSRSKKVFNLLNELKNLT